jgi:hypothetical protein
MPGELKKNIDSVPNGIRSDEEYEKIRKLI